MNTSYNHLTAKQQELVKKIPNKTANYVNKALINVIFFAFVFDDI